MPTFRAAATPLFSCQMTLIPCATSLSTSRTVPLVCRTVIKGNQLDVVTRDLGHTGDGLRQKLAIKLCPILCPPYIARGPGAFASNNAITCAFSKLLLCPP